MAAHGLHPSRLFDRAHPDRPHDRIAEVVEVVGVDQECVGQFGGRADSGVTIMTSAARYNAIFSVKSTAWFV